MECQQNRVNIPPLRAPLSRKTLGHGTLVEAVGAEQDRLLGIIRA